MRVGLNAFFQQYPTTGSGQYLKHLMGQLAAICDDEFVLFSPRLAREPHCSDLVCSSQPLVTPFAGRHEHLDKLWFEQLSVPRASSSSGVQLIHYPYFAAPLRCGLPVVVTVHDLIPLILPPYAGNALARAYSRLVASATRRATAIIADSECSRRDVIRLLNVPEDRVTVVYLAASERFQPMSDSPELAARKHQYGLDDPYVLYLGGIDCRKNVPRLLEAFAEVLRRGSGTRGFPTDLKLVIAGSIPTPSSMFPDVRGQAISLGLEDKVKFLGLVPDEDTPWLYSGAEAFVFPSLYEGFGLPPLEAMACGTPVVCSNAASLPEVVGPAAITVDAEDTAGLASAMERVLTDDNLRCDLRERGLRQARQFSWRKTAEETLRVYHQAVQSHSVRNGK